MIHKKLNKSYGEKKDIFERTQVTALHVNWCPFGWVIWTAGSGWRKQQQQGSRPSNPHFRDWSDHRLDKILTPRSPQLTRAYKIFSNPIKQYITIRVYVYVVRHCFISRFWGKQEPTVYTRTFNTCTRTQTNFGKLSRTVTVLQSESLGVRGSRQVLEPKAFFKWKASSHAETTSYTSTRTIIYAFNQPGLIMELGVGIFTPSFCSRYMPSWFLSSHQVSRKEGQR